MTEWFLARVKPNADHIARRNLERQGFRAFQPMQVRTAARCGKLVDELRPFFSGYLFVSYPAATFAPWALINSTFGVSRLVRFGDRPARVPDPVMAKFFDACDENSVIRIRQVLETGDVVEVTRGALTKSVGYVERLDSDERVLILLGILGKHTRVNFTESSLRVASGRANLSG